MFDSFISLDVFVPFRFYYNLFLYLRFNTLLIKVPLGTIVSLAFLWVLYAASSLDLHKSCSHPLHSYAVVSLVLVAYIPNHSYVRSHLFQYSRERGKGNNSFCIFSLWLRIPQIIYICLTTVADEWRKQHQNMMFSQRLFSRIFPFFHPFISCAENNKMDHFVLPEFVSTINFFIPFACYMYTPV